MKTKNNYCTNCGKFGHIYKNCLESITSLGIICFKFVNSLNINPKIIENFINNKYLNIDDFNFENINNITKLNFFKDKIKFLLIRRKHTLNYIEFIRGRYELNDNNKLVKMFKLMTPHEINTIKNNDFTILWNNLWKKTSSYKIYQKEFKKSKNKFNNLKKLGLLNDLLEIEPLYNCPEWGLPKGRRNNFEKNLDCAIREFSEETNLTKDDYTILNNLYSVQENYIGTNGVNYKHIYYISIAQQDKEVEINEANINQNYEIGDIGWFTWDESINMIRSYYQPKIDIINKIFLFAINIYLKINKQSILANSI